MNLITDGDGVAGLRGSFLQLLVKPASLHFARTARALRHTRVALTRALRARRARPPEVPEKAPYLAAKQPRAQRA